jgi:hypothetical protein
MMRLFDNLDNSVRRLLFAAACGFCAMLVGCAPAKVTSLPLDQTTTNIASTSVSATPLERDGRVVPKEELQEHCDQLARTPPGIEELRMRSDGTIESRQWVLVTHDAAPRWAIVSVGNDQAGGWKPKPAIAQLDFRPPLQSVLTKGASRFLAYAPMQSDNYDESIRLATVTEVFGEPQGKFQWRGKSYGYTLAPELVCFPRLQ